MDKELKACPFCGKRPKKIIRQGYHKIRCVNPNCMVRPCSRGCHEIEGVIEVWNNRASPPQSDNKRGAISLRNQWKAAHENDKFYVIDKLITDTIIFLGKLS